MAGKNMLDGAQVIVDYLIREKVPYAFGLCGHGNIQFIDALYGRAERDQDHLGPSRDGGRVHGRCVLPRVRPADCDLHLVRPGLGQPADRARQLVPGLGAVPGGDREHPDQPVQPRRVPGALPPLPGGLPLDRARLLQAGVPADPRRDGAARGTPSVEDHGDREARPCRARRAVRRVPRGGGGRDAEAAGVERQHFLPLRRRPRGRGKGSRHAARRRASGDPDRAGRQVWRCCRRSARARRKAADPGGLLGERHRRDRRFASARARPRRPQRALSCEPRDPPGGRPARPRRAVRRPHIELRGCPAIPSRYRRPSSSMWTSIPTRSRAIIPSRSA